MPPVRRDPQPTTPHPDRAIYEIRTGLDLMVQADEKNDTEDFKAQALHVAEWFDILDKAISSGGPLPEDWQHAATARP